MDIFSDLIDNTIDKNENENKIVNHVVFILDHSGSMSSIAEESLNNFNENIQELKNKSKTQDTYVTLINFSSRVEVVFKEVNVDNVEELNEYICSGTTALYDAVGVGINILDNIKELKDENSNHSALLIIMTDGYENASVEFIGDDGAKKINEMIKERKKNKNFSVVFFGTDDIDIKEVGNVFDSFANIQYSRVDNTTNVSNYKTIINEYFTARDLGYRNMNDYYINENHTFGGDYINVNRT